MTVATSLALGLEPGGAGGGGEGAAGPAGPPPPAGGHGGGIIGSPVADSSSSATDSSDDKDGTMGSDTEQPDVNVELRLPILIDNKIIKRDTHKKDEEERRRNPRLIVKCVCGHPKCIKRRGFDQSSPSFWGKGSRLPSLLLGHGLARDARPRLATCSALRILMMCGANFACCGAVAWSSNV